MPTYMGPIKMELLRENTTKLPGIRIFARVQNCLLIRNPEIILDRYFELETCAKQIEEQNLKK